MIKVSVVIPIYNTELYVEKCLQSIIGQTLKEIEIICVNDGSTDSSLRIIQKIAKRDTRIKVIHREKNEGVSVARNVGIRSAEGEYLVFMDSDDYLVNREALTCLYLKALEGNVDVLYFDAQVICENEQVRLENQRLADYYTRQGSYPDILPGCQLFQIFIKNHDFKPNVCLQMLHRAFLEQNCISFYEGIIHEDELFTMQCIALAKRAAYLGYPFYVRNIRPGSIMTSSTKKEKAKGYYIVYNELMKFAWDHSLEMDQEFYTLYLNRAGIILQSAADNFEQCDLQERRDLISSFGGEERVYFDLCMR